MITVRVDSVLKDSETHLHLNLDSGTELGVVGYADAFGGEPVARVTVSSGGSFIRFKGTRTELVELFMRALTSADPSYAVSLAAERG
ncbi:MAG: hypothetical protein JWP02_85 [Acidimicrobiales bacterium]|nr:hypothetical protein [Acidimicrobiales bacterium]